MSRMLELQWPLGRDWASEWGRRNEAGEKWGALVENREEEDGLEKREEEDDDERREEAGGRVLEL